MSQDVERLQGVVTANATLHDERGSDQPAGLIDHVGAIVWTPGAEGSAAYLNDRVFDVTGYPREAFAREPGLWVSIVHPEDRDDVVRLRRRALGEGLPYERDLRIETADGRSVWVHEIVTVDGDGVARGLTLDIDARKRTERLLDAEVRTARALGDAGTLTDATPAILEAAAEAGAWDVAVLFGAAPLAQILRCVDVWHGSHVDPAHLREQASRTIVSPGSGPIARSWGTRLPVWIDDVAGADDPILDAAAADGLRCGAAIPLLGGGRPAGVLVLLSGEERHRDEHLFGIGAGIGTHLAVFMDRQRIEQEQAFDRALLDSQNEATIDAIYVVAPDGTVMSSNRRFAELWGIEPETIATVSSDDLTAMMLERVADPDRFLERFRHLMAHPEEHGRDEITLRDGRVLDRWSAPLQHREAAITYGRAWYFRDVTEERRAERHATFLADATAILSSSLAYEENIAELARLAVPTLADWCVIDIVDEDGSIKRVAVAHPDPARVALAGKLEATIRRRPDPQARRGVDRVIRTGEAELASEIADGWLVEASHGDDELLAQLRALGLRSYICAPLAARGRLLGVMTFLTAESGRRYGDRDLAFARDLAGRVALLVDNLRLYVQRDRIARTLQDSLLPAELPPIAGLEVAAHYAAAGEAYDVGGDFYDAFSMGRRTWGVVIGDVCGKGPDAAAITALARNTVRVAAMQARKPKKILALLNQAIYGQFDGTRFATVTFARIQPQPDGVDVLVCRGGHPPSLVLRADGTVTSLRGQGSLIGALPEVTLADLPSRLTPGEMLLLYTDGIIEARRGTATFGQERLQALLAGCGGMSAAACVAAIVDEVTAFSDGPLRDDIAVLALRVDAATLPRPVARERASASRP